MSLFDLLFSKKPTINQNSNTINAVPRPSKGECYAVIDTETTWSDEVMSIGIVIADSYDNTAIDTRYYIIDPVYRRGGMYSNVLNIIKKEQTIIANRKLTINNIVFFLSQYNVKRIFAYNAKFDFNHLPELRSFHWYDIMRVAAYNHTTITFLLISNAVKPEGSKKDMV